MRRSLTILCAVFLGVGVARGQILNAGFESWTNGEPDGWQTSNAAPQLINVSPSSDAHSGSFSLRAEVVSYANSLFAPTLQNRSTSHKGSGVNQRVSALTGWIKFHSDSGDVLQISLVAAMGESAIGGGSLITSNEVSEWDQISIPISYTFSSYVPDTILIYCSIKGAQSTAPHLGTWFELDDLGFSDPVEATGFEKGESSDLSVYPNPVSSFSTLRLRIPTASMVRAVVYDINGQEVSTVYAGISGSSEVSFPIDASSLSNGVYYLRVEGGGKQFGRTLIVRH